MDYEKITLQIKKIQEQQDQSQQYLKQHEQITQDVHELNVKGNRLFNELSDTWGKDKRMASEIDHKKRKLRYRERHIQFKLEEKKERILKEQCHLFNLEEELFKKRKQQIKKEENK